jgi:DNA-binding transcriptional LysR family regulator
MDRLESLRLFVEVVDRESFSDAARALGVSRSTASKSIVRLEEHLGVRLLERTTRQVRATESGRAYHARCQRILADLDEAESMLSSLHSEPRGLLRISAPASFGRDYISPVVSAYLAAHPSLSMEVSYSDRRVDLLEEGIDLAVRIGVLPDSSLVARRLRPMHRRLCASPAWRASHGPPQHPEEIEPTDCLRFAHQVGGDRWEIEGPDGQRGVIQARGRLRCDSGELLRRAAEDGLGVVLLPGFMVAEALAAGRLVELLPGWSEAPSALWVVYPHNRHLSARVRGFVDALAQASAGWGSDHADPDEPR